MENEKNLYRYYMIYRPASIGTIPSNQQNKLYELVNIVNFDTRCFITEIGKKSWGYIEYKKPLTSQLINDYELFEMKGM